MKIEDVRFKAKIKGIKTLGKVFTIQYYTNCNEIAELDIILPFTKEIQKELGKEDYFHRIDYDEDYISVNIGFKDIDALLPYTGFKDKEGKELYEYDLVWCLYNGIVYVIEWLKYDGCFGIIPLKDFKKGIYLNWEMLQGIPSCDDEDHTFIKIGNYFGDSETIKTEKGINQLFCMAMKLDYVEVFENPELLKKEQY